MLRIGFIIGRNALKGPVAFENWTIIFPERDNEKIREFAAMVQQVCPFMGINVSDPHYVAIANDRTETFSQALNEIINPTARIVVRVFPNPRDDRYSGVKTLCFIEFIKNNIPSLCMNSKIISNVSKFRSVFRKIILEINCKLDGGLWSLPTALENLMVCGMDSYHDNTRGRRSVLALVASINQNRTHWFSMAAMQKQGQEVGNYLTSLFIKVLMNYQEVNHKLPEKIIMYRNGVGDDLMGFVQKYEVEQMLSGFKHFKNGYEPSLTVVVVEKKIHRRMYLSEQLGNSRMPENPPPNTILDPTVIRKGWYDFFLVSQHVQVDTVTPIHCVVIHDSSKLEPEHVQRITSKMTHMWPGTVLLPAPCQYAHKLACLVGQNLHHDTNLVLSDRLFNL